MVALAQSAPMMKIPAVRRAMRMTRDFFFDMAGGGRLEVGGLSALTRGLRDSFVRLVISPPAIIAKIGVIGLYSISFKRCIHFHMTNKFLR